ncbi:MAG: tetratricopeptide repeat protein, partial [Bacteroidetes bacterium]|nr:tetratricopeptide repeat protein [Bacteroidota bacterium]
MSILKRILLIISIVMLTVVAMAQSVEDAGAKYNEGNAFFKEGAYGKAVTSYENALKIANSVGTDADALKGNIEKQLMNAYFKNGLLQYKGRKYDAAVAYLEKAYAISGRLDDESMKTSTSTYIAKVRSTKGNSLLKENKVDEAFAEYEIALEVEPTCVNAYYGKGLVYKSKDDMDNMVVNMDKVIEYG